MGIVYTLTAPSQTGNLDAWKVQSGTLTWQSQAADTLELAIGLALPGAGPLSEDDTVTLTAAIAGTSRTLFSGKVTKVRRITEAGHYGVLVTCSNAWRDLEITKYQQPWISYGYQDGHVTTATEYRTHLNLFWNAPDNTLASNGWQIGDAVNWGRQCGIALQPGTITPALYLPPDEKTGLFCAEVIRSALTLCPDCSTWVDYSTTPPSLNCQHAAQMPYAALDITSVGQISRPLERCWELEVPSVVLLFEYYDKVNGQSRRKVQRQAAPDGATGTEIGAEIETISIRGMNSQTQRVTVNSMEWSPIALPFWTEFHPWLTDPTLEGLAFSGFAANGFPLDGITLQPYLLLDTAMPAWLGAVQQTIELQCVASWESKGSKMQQLLCAKITTTDCPPGTYSAQTEYSERDYVPAGMADYLYHIWGQVQVKGSFKIQVEKFGDIIAMGQRINLASYDAGWASAVAPIQTSTLNLMDGIQELSFGPPGHINGEQLLRLSTWNRFRRSSMLPTGMSGGDSGGGTLDSGGQTPGAFGAQNVPTYTKLQVGNISIDGELGVITLAVGDEKLELRGNSFDMYHGDSKSVRFTLTTMANGQHVTLVSTGVCDGSANLSKLVLRQA